MVFSFGIITIAHKNWASIHFLKTNERISLTDVFRFWWIVYGSIFNEKQYCFLKVQNYENLVAYTIEIS